MPFPMWVVLIGSVVVLIVVVGGLVLLVLEIYWTRGNRGSTKEK